MRWRERRLYMKLRENNILHSVYITPEHESMPAVAIKLRDNGDLYFEVNIEVDKPENNPLPISMKVVNQSGDSLANFDFLEKIEVSETQNIKNLRVTFVYYILMTSEEINNSDKIFVRVVIDNDDLNSMTSTFDIIRNRYNKELIWQNQD